MFTVNFVFLAQNSLRSQPARPQRSKENLSLKAIHRPYWRLGLFFIGSYRCRGGVDPLIKRGGKTQVRFVVILELYGTSFWRS